MGCGEAMTQFTPGYKKERKKSLSSASEQQKSAAMDTQDNSVLKQGFLVKRVSRAFRITGLYYIQDILIPFFSLQTVCQCVYCILSSPFSLSLEHNKFLKKSLIDV